MTSPEINGETITFYSYKGGTGRSMALSNVACLLAKRKFQSEGILMIDWDLEAPGLNKFFYDKFTQIPVRDFMEKPGLIDLFLKLNEATPNFGFTSHEEAVKVASDALNSIVLEEFIVKTDIPNLSLLKAGRMDKDYSHRVSTFDWESLYNRSPLLIRLFAERLTKKYSYILIDSRTGYTDIGGICTMLMPQKLVVVFTPNSQSYDGINEMVKKATEYRRQSRDLRPLLVFPLPSRIEFSRDDLRADWRFGNAERNIEGYQPMFEELFTEVYELNKYLFSWDSVLDGKDNNKLLSFLKEVININWGDLAGIATTVEDRSIHIFNEKNLVEIKLYENDEKAMLKVGDGRTYSLKVKNEKDRLNVYYNECKLGDYFNDVQIQQSPDYAYGEKIAVEIEKTMDRFSLTKSYETFTEWLVNSAAPWQRMKEYKKCDIFLSYASSDRAIAQGFAEVLERQGWSVWWDVIIPTGETFDQVIEKALEDVKCIIVLWSKDAVKSDWVKDEAAAGIDRRILLQVLIDDVKMPLAFRKIPAVRLTGLQGDLSGPEFDKILMSVAKILGYPITMKDEEILSGQPELIRARQEIEKAKKEDLSIQLLRAIEFLREGRVKEFNKFRSDNPEIKIEFHSDFSDLELSEVDLSGSNLSSAYISKTKLTNANLSGADLTSINLTGSDISYADLSKADMSGAELFEVKLINTNLSEADLSEAKLSKANFSGANLTLSKLPRSYLSWADLSGADLSGADLSEANLSGANLSKANLQGANLLKANLSRANLLNAKLSKANLSGADLSDTNISEAKINGVNLSYANLSGANFIGADISNSILSGANLIKADFSNTNLTGADLSGLDFSNTKLVAADLSKSNLSGTKLNFKNLSGTKLIGANLNKAYLIGTKLTEADLSQANLKEANLLGANLSKVKLIEADLTNAYLSKTNFNQANLLAAKLIGVKLYETNFSEANLTNADLSGLDLSNSKLVGTDFSKAKLVGANLSELYNLSKVLKLADADLSGAKLSWSNLSELDISGAKLTYADLRGARLHRTRLTGSDLAGADLCSAKLIGTDLTEANLYGANLSGIVRLIEATTEGVKVNAETKAEKIMVVNEEDSNNIAKTKEALTTIDEALREIILRDNKDLKGIYTQILKPIYVDEEIEDMITTAWRLYNGGMYKKAFDKLKDVLNIDSGNKIALKGIERVEEKIRKEQKTTEVEKERQKRFNKLLRRIS